MPEQHVTLVSLAVADLEAARRFYVDGLGFTIKIKWEPDGRIRWCWLERDNVSLMLQEFWKKGEHGDSPGPPETPFAPGMSICFMCSDAIALYRQFCGRGIAAARPFVGNGLWVTSVMDPDGYKL